MILLAPHRRGQPLALQRLEQAREPLTMPRRHHQRMPSLTPEIAGQSDRQLLFTRPQAPEHDRGAGRGIPGGALGRSLRLEISRDLDAR